MTIVEPPEIAPPELPRQDDAEALIEEARRRTRRRRLAYAVAAVLVLALGGAVVVVLSLTGGRGKTSAEPPPGFVLVKAQGPVAHVLLDYRLSFGRHLATSTSLATGRDRPAKSTDEIWYDRKSGRVRVVRRIDGRKQFDVAGRECQLHPHFCFPPPPFIPDESYRWPIDGQSAREIGRGTFEGREVVWVKSLDNGRPIPGGRDNRFALDAQTHRLVVDRDFVGGRMMREDVITWMKTLPANGFSFVVPKGSDTEGEFPPIPAPATIDRPSSLQTARTALGRTVLWLGRSYGGHRVGPVTVGDEVMRTKTEPRLLPARFVRFFYGDFQLEEFGSVRPYFWLQGPRPGYLVREGQNEAVLSRHGLLVRIISPNGQLTRASVLAIAKALRPLPASR